MSYCPICHGPHEVEALSCMFGPIICDDCLGKIRRVAGISVEVISEDVEEKEEEKSKAYVATGLTRFISGFGSTNPDKVGLAPYKVEAKV
jgi:hypothetical protein